MSQQKTPSPMMQQWHDCKERAKDAILLFRMGDFYEAFYDDAPLLAKELELTLTKRQDIAMAGVPAHSCDGYIDKLVSKGYRVAIAEQLEDPKNVKGLVKRDVVRVVSPGTAISSSLLADKSNNYIACISRSGKQYGLAFLDVSTADFNVIELDNVQALQDELHRIQPSEVVSGERFHKANPELFAELKSSGRYLLSTIEEWHFEQQAAYDLLTEQLGVHNLNGYGLQGMVAGVNAAGALLYYLRDELCQPLDHVRSISTYNTSDFLVIDKATQRNLELIRSLRDGSRQMTLFSTLDRTITAMGGRRLQQWICQPLLDPAAIEERQRAIGHLCDRRETTEKLVSLLERVRDIERLIMKVSANYASPRELVMLRQSLDMLPHIRASLTDAPALLAALANQIEDHQSIATLIATTLVDDPPARLQDGAGIRHGVHTELDELRSLERDSKNWIANYQQNLRDTLDIKSLKVGFNRMFGYYIEVSRSQANKMPDTFQRRQTLVNSERFLSPDLKEYEEKVLSAEERIATIEQELFLALRKNVATHTESILRSASALAQIDCLLSLATVAAERGYCCPVVDDGHTIAIEEGCHPVLAACSTNEPFVPNSTRLDCDGSQLHLITGPNMGGKSTYIRQVALLVLMTQMGSFIPAKSARIGITDRLFSRIGASDDLARGQSTFMVEMTETANILNNATDRSLVILDEIGRGTSTYDGISIAWAIAEYLLTTPGRQARTLFATHYFELTRLEQALEGAVNYNVAVEELAERIIFLRKVVPGPADRSYGIHVGELAGLPRAVVDRSRQLLCELETQAQILPKKRRRKSPPSGQPELQLSLFEPPITDEPLSTIN